MNRPLSSHAFEVSSPTWRVEVRSGLPAALDAVADLGAPERRFLRRAWFGAAVDAYGGNARTFVAATEAEPGIALPVIPLGPASLRVGAVPGCYWPYRSFPVATEDAACWDALCDALGRELNGLRIGPVYDDDAALGSLLAAARRAGWAVLPRKIADSFVLDLPARDTDSPWPRNSTLRKNRFHEKHLAAHGALHWEFVESWDDTTFADLAQVEEASWIARRTDGRDAKFTASGHGAFWRAAAADPVMAAMMRAALLRVEGRPVAFSFDLDAGAIKHAIANSYDTRFAKHSPGKLLYYRNLVAARERGIATVDWGAGDSGYKSVIGAERGPAIRDWLLVRPGVPATLARRLAPLWARTGR